MTALAWGTVVAGVLFVALFAAHQYHRRCREGEPE